MGNCNSTFNCTACSNGGCDEPIKVDADIVGPGVLASFFVSATLTVLSIIYGYISDCLPVWYLNGVDRAILARYRKSWFAMKTISYVEASWAVLTDFTRAIFRRPKKLYPDPIDPDKRKEALARFVLAMSDQQLVTGLAILIGAIGSRCTLSIYEFNMVVSLAWFSSTTHLATLSVLRDYFIRHQVVRNLRVIGMVTMLALLLLCILNINTSDVDSSAPMQCASNTAPDTLTTGLILLYLLYSYTDRIGHLFNDRSDANKGSWSNRELVLRLCIPLYDSKLNIDPTDFKRIIQEVVSEKKLRGREKMLGQTSKFEALKSKAVATFDYRSYFDSFLATIPIWIFDLTYGIVQVSYNRWQNPPNMTDDENVLSYGQIVSILLLTLPALVAAEIYYDAKKLDKAYKPQAHLASNMPMRPGDATRSLLTSGLYLPDPIHPHGARNQIDALYHSRPPSTEYPYLHRRSFSLPRFNSPTEDNFKSRKRLSFHQLVDPSASPESTTFIIIIFVFWCLVAIGIGFLLNLVGVSTYLIIIISVSLWPVGSWTIVKMITTFTSAYRRILEHQASNKSEDANHSKSIDGHDFSLQEVVVSPAQSRCGSIFDMRGALNDQQTSQPSSLEHQLASEAGGNDSLQAQVGNPEDRHPDLVSMNEQRGGLAQHQNHPQRQDTASSSATEPLQSASSGQNRARRVNTK